MPGDTSKTAAFDPMSEIQALKDTVAKSAMPQGLRDKIDKMLLRLSRMIQMGNYTSEYESVEQYVRWAIQMPWGKLTKDNLDLTNARNEMVKHHYGLDPIKDRIIEYLAVIKLQREGAPPPGSLQPQPTIPAQAVINPSAPIAVSAAQPVPAPVAVVPSPAQPSASDPATEPHQEMARLQGSSSHAPVLCFVGIQGVGKTSMAKSIAGALGRGFVRVALGALGDISQIRGRARTESNAEPGQIIKALIRAGTMNPVILLDEIDKTSSESGLRSDLMAALLEILDPEQNSTFTDHYLDYPVDLSQVMFITTSNNLGGISAALLDRLEVIRFGSYTDEEKMNIAKQYMLPKVREATGITEQQLSFDDDVWPMVVRPIGFDAGVRELERTLTLLARKVARMIVEGKAAGVRVTKDNFREFIPADIGVYS